jgi:hypothetical protein
MAARSRDQYWPPPQFALLLKPFFTARFPLGKTFCTAYMASKLLCLSQIKEQNRARRDRSMLSPDRHSYLFDNAQLLSLRGMNASSAGIVATSL